MIAEQLKKKGVGAIITTSGVCVRPGLDVPANTILSVGELPGKNTVTEEEAILLLASHAVAATDEHLKEMNDRIAAKKSEKEKTDREKSEKDEGKKR